MAVRRTVAIARKSTLASQGPHNHPTVHLLFSEKKSEKHGVEGSYVTCVNTILESRYTFEYLGTVKSAANLPVFVKRRSLPNLIATEQV